ncbi:MULTISPECIES: 3D domain-containing protein [Flavobacteriaceae]|uniref:3D domain-containing protein n=1 Tax=Flavobacteriaceae TaxID=49546 RepID=UPI002348FDD5|nr:MULTISPECIES: hypothetical protein [Allomuricauda]MDC6364656.1 hypothetical protein [Muricauda sp. AC10]
MKTILAILLLTHFNLTSCRDKTPLSKQDSQYVWYGYEVTASAYNSVAWQTDKSFPSIAAWGDTLKPGMKCIAISRDLIQLGLTHNTMVKIDTFPDTFYVKDKMHRRWKNRIDIYMGLDVKKARLWGKKKLQICYALPIDTTTTKFD